jgi:methyltransferase
VDPYVLLIFLIALERVAELAVARRNARWSQQRGAREFGRGHYPVIVAAHCALLGGCLVEPPLAHRPFIPALGVPMLALVLLAQPVRLWCIKALGHQWNTRVLVIPGQSLVRTGPYRYLRHPNYAAVAVEGAALPLIHTAWLTCVCFTIANAAILTVRIRCETAAHRWALSGRDVSYGGADGKSLAQPPDRPVVPTGGVADRRLNA